MQRKMVTVQQVCTLAALTVIKHRLKGTNKYGHTFFYRKRLDFLQRRCIKKMRSRGCSRLQSKAAERMSLQGGKIYEQICKNDKTKTNVMRLLDAAKISYESKEYPVDEHDLSGEPCG